MINTTKVIKVSMLWISITYVICYIGVALIPEIRQQFMLYALHTSVDTGENILSITNFITGLILWNLITGFGIWLFAVLFNKIKD